MEIAVPTNKMILIIKVFFFLVIKYLKDSFFN
jgi:hypothetical protein